MFRYRFRCDGLDRRDFLRIGALSPIAAGGWWTHSLADASARRPNGRRQRNCILIWLDGGPSHLETFDPKPDMPVEIRGPLGSIATAIPGVRLGECLPKLGERLAKCSLLRAVTSPLGEHNLGAHYLLTGYQPTPALEYPVMGSALDFLSKPTGALPQFVAIPDHRMGGGTLRAHGYLPARTSPFEVRSDPARAEFTVPDLQFYPGLDRFRIERRREYLQSLDRFARELDRAGYAGDDVRLEQAIRLIDSPEAKAAFALEQEPEERREAYGQTTFGQSCLLARRLVGSGVRFVTINFTGWDTHDNLAVRLRDGYAGAKQPVGLIPTLDRGIAALLDDLEREGLWDSTLVVVMGEFGRTPKINAAGGRDHWPRAFSVLLAGGGVPRGLVLGESDRSGEAPLSDAVTPADLVASIYTVLGFDPEAELQTADGRPVKLVGDGHPIRELCG